MIVEEAVGEHVKMVNQMKGVPGEEMRWRELLMNAVCLYVVHLCLSLFHHNPLIIPT